MSRKIYFCGSIRGGRQDVGLYAKIIKTLGSYGQVLTEHVGDDDLDKNDLDDKGIHDRDVEWLQGCDAVVAEVTQPSMGVGYELGRARAMGKKILCLFRPDTGKLLSGLVNGADNGESFAIKNYKEEEYPGILKEYFDQLSKENVDEPVAAKKMKMTDDGADKESQDTESSPSKERKVYFCGSITGGRQDASIYSKIVEEIKTSYGQVLTENVAKEDPIIAVNGQKVSDKEIHEMDMKWLQSSTDVVAEVTQVSTGVGYEIGRAVGMNKRILCLYRSRDNSRISAMISGAHNGTSFIVKDYKVEEYVAVLKEFFQ
ncbi:uncharacterized protein LOC110979255 isoform X2 [Acanthaster planci]|uniref:Putative 2'-deoxynucleoside 5'-phosphate N-hydrolase 1 n=1 Tax=Acanthaster planci TaxID=133434 RepID=A0A8B7YDW5_ACAPL|nr:uncharacterized protein LOC110979255 isoform X2 [Acanthaster planci]